MSTTPTLYELRPDAGQLTVDQVWSQNGSGPIGADTAHLVPIAAADGTNLLAVNAAGTVTVLKVETKEPYFEPLPGKVDLGKGACDSISPLTLGGLPHLLTYRKQSGEVSVVPVIDGANSGVPYLYQRKHHPGLTGGYDVVAPVTVNGGCYLMFYRGDTGDVAIHELRMLVAPPPGSAAGAPSVQAQPTWIHQWAPDWTRFAFFTLGAESYFLKTNTGKLNVNIDHVLDNPALGTVEVGTYLHLDDALALDKCIPFTLGGDPHFVAYQASGDTVLYRIHGDCQGWTAMARFSAPANATSIVPIAAGDSYHLLFA